MESVSQALLAEHQVEAGWPFAIRKRTEWRDTDGFGHINHLAYLAWCEDARNFYLEDAGLPRLAANVPGPVLKQVTFNYGRSLMFGDELIVTARTLAVRQTSFQMEYAIWHHGLIGGGTALVVLIVNATGERVQIPAPVRALMISRDGAKDESAPR